MKRLLRDMDLSAFEGKHSEVFDILELRAVPAEHVLPLYMLLYELHSRRGHSEPSNEDKEWLRARTTKALASPVFNERSTAYHEAAVQRFPAFLEWLKKELNLP